MVSTAATAPAATASAPGERDWRVAASVILFGMWSQGCSFGATFFSFTLWIDPWRHEFGTQPSVIMLVITTFCIGRGLLSPVCGHWLDRMPARQFLAIGGATLGVGMALVAYAQALWQVFLIYSTLIAIGATVLGPLSAQVYVVRAFDRRRGLALGLVSLGSSIGAMIIPAAAAHLLLTADWREAHRVIGLAIVAMLLPMLWLVAPRLEPPAGARHAVAKRNLREGFALIRQPALYIPMLANLALMGAFNAVQQNLGPFGLERGFDARFVAQLVMTGSAFGILGKVAFGAVSDHLDHKRLFWLTCVLQALCIGLMMATHARFMLLLAMALFGLSSGAGLPLLGSMLASRFPPQVFGTVFGVALIANNFSIFGAPLAGWLREIGGSYDLALAAVMLLVALGAIAMIFLPPPHRSTSL